MTETGDERFDRAWRITMIVRILQWGVIAWALATRLSPLEAAAATNALMLFHQALGRRAGDG